MTEQLRTAVVGVGYLGHYHAQKMATLPQSQLVAVCDIDPTRCQEIALEHQIQGCIDYQQLLGKVDAISIAVPTVLHHKIALFFLQHGVHVLLEKPIATSLTDADELIAAAKKSGALLQIGHLERYNNVIKAAFRHIKNPLFIESNRLAPFKVRGTDVNVVLDLMIHDIDIIQTIMKTPIKEIRAHGASVLSPHLDIANAHIEFNNGCVANAVANRMSMHRERKLRIYQPHNYITLDLDNKSLAIYHKGQHVAQANSEIVQEKQSFDQCDPLKDQIEDFLNAIIHQRPATVSGEDGRNALKTAIEITDIVLHRHRELELMMT